MKNEKPLSAYPTMDKIILAILAMLSTSHLPAQEKSKPLVRLAIIEVEASHHASYHEFLKEEIEASIQKEPGVITCIE